MAENLLLKSQANEVFQMLTAARLSPEDFELGVIGSVFDRGTKVSILVHRSSGYYFQFDFRTQGHYCRYSPGDSQIEKDAYTGDWYHQKQTFLYWVGYLKREIEAPDLWASISEEKLLSNASTTSDDDSPFSTEETIRIQNSLFEIKQYLLSTQSFSTEQTSFLSGRFQYLEDASTRLGRKDWIILAVGTLTNIVISLALAPSIARELFRIAGTLLKWILKSHLIA